MQNNSFQDRILGILKDRKIGVRVYLVNGVHVDEIVKAFDQYAVLIDDGKQQSIIYKHAISTITPSTPLPASPDSIQPDTDKA
ncbi:RNA chaperone Hfq [Athalassotoga saccharophila]|uniref:RNA-binding protein Hfq n=1 Tax=Athalassotoga saccharophila TaxID=1441386 RepID=A0A6N4TEF2_9BACT|nr:RNA chaperone Hfq [Athalassotoga saccharophila]BBJ29051.1 RNA-binding protein Hfq [Athalassotoga saccharophila]